MSEKKQGLWWLVRGVLSHPANKGQSARALVRLALWQVWKRTVRREIIIHVRKGAKFLVVPDSKFSSQVVYTELPEWEEMNFLLRFLRSSDSFLDIGANVGFYTVLASTIIKGGRIVAVEANSRNVAILRRQISINSLENIAVVESALGEVDGVVTFVDADRETGTVLSRREHGQRGEEVECTRLDTLIRAKYPTESYALAKMDVEGSEMMILRGAQDVLQARQVRTWMFEVSNDALRSHGSTAGELMSVFSEYGYTLHLWSEREARLLQLSSSDVLPPNIIACSDAKWTEERCRSASTFFNS
jgi:FkbM family methyltransferase